VLPTMMPSIRLDTTTSAISFRSCSFKSGATFTRRGGVTCGSDAYQKIINGASLVQFYSAMVYQGPGMAKRVAQELAECLREGGYSSVEEAVGVAVS